MDGITLEITLLFIILILLAITLFLGVVNALFLSKLFAVVSRQLVRQGERTGEPKQRVSAVSGDRGVPTQKMSMPPRADILDARDISDGLRIIAERYGLDGLTVSSTDGLALGSYGVESPSAEAARYSHLHAIGEAITDPGVTISQMEFQGSPLIAIIRSAVSPTDEISNTIKDEVRRLFERWL